MEKELPYFNEQLSRILNFYFSVYGKKCNTIPVRLSAIFHLSAVSRNCLFCHFFPCQIKHSHLGQLILLH